MKLFNNKKYNYYFDEKTNKYILERLCLFRKNYIIDQYDNISDLLKYIGILEVKNDFVYCNLQSEQLSNIRYEYIVKSFQSYIKYKLFNFSNNICNLQLSYSFIYIINSMDLSKDDIYKLIKNNNFFYNIFDKHISYCLDNNELSERDLIYKEILDDIKLNNK